MFGMDYMRSHFTHQQRYIVVAILSIFLPSYMCYGVLLFLFLRLLLKKEILPVIKKDKFDILLYLFCIISFIVSLYYKNYYGAGIAIGGIPFISLILYIREYMSPRLFDFLTKWIVALSLLAAFYGLIEYMAILNHIDISTFSLIIFNSPKDRINSFYFNANYYAMMIEFFVMISFYKILKIKNLKEEFKSFFYYVVVILINLFMLVLTACRTAWLAIPAAFVAILFFDKHYRTCMCIAAVAIFAGAFFIINPSLFPRFDNVIAYFFTRKGIWETAIACIKDHPFFGEGPMTYWHIYKAYGGHPTQHAHNVYLDPILNFGIVGCSIMIPTIYQHIRGVYYRIKGKESITEMALILSMTVVVLVHGTMDVTIFFVQTLFLYLFVVNSYLMFDHDDKNIVEIRYMNANTEVPDFENIWVGIDAITEKGAYYFKELLEEPEKIAAYVDSTVDGLTYIDLPSGDLAIVAGPDDVHRLNIREVLK